MSWTHAICLPCWEKRHGARVPVAVADAPSVACCYCGAATAAGIFVRESPREVPCEGRCDHLAKGPQ